MSGSPAQPADRAPPERYTASKPSRSASFAVSALKAPGIMIGRSSSALRSRVPGEFIGRALVSGSEESIPHRTAPILAVPPGGRADTIGIRVIDSRAEEQAVPIH